MCFVTYKKKKKKKETIELRVMFVVNDYIYI